MKITKKSEKEYELEEGDSSENLRGVLFSVESVDIDPLGYKKISPSLTPYGKVLVELDLEESDLLGEEDGVVEVTAKGFWKMMLRFSDKLRNLYDEEF